MSIAPGGLIEQAIVKDPYEASKWDMPRALCFNVQILNSDRFRTITGLEAPSSPISAQTYADHGLPYFEIYDEQSDVHGNFAGVKSVHALDVEKAPEDESTVEEEASVNNPVIHWTTMGVSCASNPLP